MFHSRAFAEPYARDGKNWLLFLAFLPTLFFAGCTGFHASTGGGHTMSVSPRISRIPIAMEMTIFSGG